MVFKHLDYQVDLDVNYLKSFSEEKFLKEFQSEDGIFPHLKGKDRESYLKGLYGKITGNEKPEKK